MSDDHGNDLLGERERQLDSAASSELAGLAVADAASRVLADLIQRAPVPPRATAPTAEELAFRAARAAIWVSRVGYEDQAVAHVRLIDELHNRGRAVVMGDRKPIQNGSRIGVYRSGQQFPELLAGELGPLAQTSAGEPFPSVVPARVFTNLLRPRLCSVRSVGRRWPNGTLVYIAGELRDIAAMLSAAAGMPLDGLALLTAEIQAAQREHWGPDADAVT